MKKQAYEKLMGLHKQAEINYGPQSNTIKVHIRDIVNGLSLAVKAVGRVAKHVVNPVGAIADDIKSGLDLFGPSKPKSGAPMDKPTWKERLKARIFDP